jgi:hypothetical protein
LTLPGLADGGHHFVDQRGWESPGEHPEGNVVREVLVVNRLDPSSPRHTVKNNTPVVLTERYWA